MIDEQTYNNLFRFIQNKTKQSKENIEDCFQDSIVSLLESDYDPNKNLYSYFYTIFNRNWIDKIKKETRRKKHNQVYASQKDLVYNNQENLDENRSHYDLNTFNLLRLCYCSGITIEQAAISLDIPLETLRTRLKKIRKDQYE